MIAKHEGDHFFVLEWVTAADNMQRTERNGQWATNNGQRAAGGTNGTRRTMRGGRHMKRGTHEMRHTLLPYPEASEFAVKGTCHLQSHFIQTFLEFGADHHPHHHIEFGVQHQSYSGIIVGDLFHLEPQREIHRRTVIA